MGKRVVKFTRHAVALLADGKLFGSGGVERELPVCLCQCRSVFTLALHHPCHAHPHCSDGEHTRDNNGYVERIQCRVMTDHRESQRRIEQTQSYAADQYPARVILPADEEDEKLKVDP